MRGGRTGLGGAPPPKHNLHRWVKWPKYVRIQRQRRVLNQRLKVPPALNRFTRAVDRNLAETIFKLLMKYRPETKQAKKQRLVQEAEARSSGIKYDKKKPVRGPLVFALLSPRPIPKDFVVGNRMLHIHMLVVGVLYALFVCVLYLSWFVYCSPW